MDSDLHSMELPAFELDCREWLVATPDDGSVPEEIAGAPVVAVLSTVVIGDQDFEPASAILSVGLLDEPVTAVEIDDRSPVAELVDVDFTGGHARYVVPAPDSRLALLAEFSGGEHCDDELMRRFERLMTSFRWAS
ncbi:hypothetical protein M6D93_17395 [Jatrophihabitans telluris]|uniref:Type II toxin-antitoxin system PemK/MazF family toxin n=1 Tax=Jatrophihabitans telluris TaxID=2038343 RepID=A0ABY4QXG7_9ACTN|nr:hypothetical protein [Jatrophihabitans telluris]UQX88049.1 hypothetical protein M6D93_17395 [Jatrophihabitans telluris]